MEPTLNKNTSNPIASNNISEEELYLFIINSEDSQILSCINNWLELDSEILLRLLNRLIGEQQTQKANTFASICLNKAGLKSHISHYITWLNEIRNISKYRKMAFNFNIDTPEQPLPPLLLKSVGEKPLVITIDDGPSTSFTEILLGLLAKYGFSAVFFLIGEKCIDNKHILEKIYNAGHQIYGHSYDHSKHYTSMSESEILQDFTKTKNAIGPFSDSRYYRLPGGVGQNDSSIKSFFSSFSPETTLLYWSALCDDSHIVNILKKSPDKKSELIIRVAKLISELKNKGNVLLLHDNSLDLTDHESISLMKDFYEFLFFVLKSEGYSSKLL